MILKFIIADYFLSFQFLRIALTGYLEMVKRPLHLIELDLLIVLAG